MKLSSRARYALRAMMVIARESGDGKPVNLGLVAERTSISRIQPGEDSRSRAVEASRPADATDPGEVSPNRNAEGSLRGEEARELAGCLPRDKIERGSCPAYR